MDEVARTLRDLHTCGSQLTISDDEVRLASTIVHAMRGVHKLALDIQDTGQWATDLPRLRRLLKTLRFALVNDDHNGFFETLAVPGDEEWPTHATSSGVREGDEIVFQQHTDIGVLYGNPVLHDGCVYLWHREATVAADHIFAVQVPDVPNELVHDPRMLE